MNSSFTSFLFSLPISHICISLFSVFSLLLIFNLIWPCLKVIWFYFSTSHTSDITKIHALSSICLYMIHQVTYFVVRWLAGYLVNALMLIPSLPVQNLPFVCHYNLFQCEGCAIHMLDIHRSLFQLQCWNLLVLFSCYNWELFHIPSPKNYKVLLWPLHLLCSWCVCW